MSYEELVQLPEESPFEGPPGFEDLRFLLRRETAKEDYEDVPVGTVEVAICAEVRERGRSVLGGVRASFEKRPSGEFLDPMRGWEGD